MNEARRKVEIPADLIGACDGFRTCRELAAVARAGWITTRREMELIEQYTAAVDLPMNDMERVIRLRLDFDEAARAEG